MPINFLQNIKSLSLTSGSIGTHNIVCGGLKSEHIAGAYIFTCKNLNSSQPLFNDGIPSVILMSRKSDKVILKGQTEDIVLNSAWMCCGVIKNTHWAIPRELEHILVVRFKPASFYSLFDVSPSVFLSRPICNLTDIISEKWNQVFNEMYEKETMCERISFLDDALSLHKTCHNFPYILNIATQYIEDQKGDTSVAEVLPQLGKGVNSKWLHRNFVKYIGIPPKKYISLQRFIYSYNECKLSKTKDLAGLILISGYYDYNHFVKDFKRYIGIAPSHYSWD